MLQRTQNAAFLGGRRPRRLARSAGRRHAPRRRPHREAGQRALQLESGAIAYYVAAIRECFEEAGILLARDRNGEPVTAERAWSTDPLAQKPFRELLEAEDLYIPQASLAYFGHWITAPGARGASTRASSSRSRRGPARLERRQRDVHDVWITPREALERARAARSSWSTRRRPR